VPRVGVVLKLGNNKREEELFIKNTGLRRIPKHHMRSDVCPTFLHKPSVERRKDKRKQVAALTLSVIM